MSGPDDIPSWPIFRLHNRLLKRAMDLVGSALGLALTWPIILLAYLVAAADTGESGFFAQERVGLNGRLFSLYKVRTMRSGTGPTTNVTTAADPRITSVGRIMRRLKIDELPQLWNVLRGEMSLVGPRPDLPEMFEGRPAGDRVVLLIRPGITGPATLRYRDEEGLLAAVANPDLHNRDVIFPAKVRLNRQYMKNYRLGADCRYILWTLLGCWERRGP